MAASTMLLRVLSVFAELAPRPPRLSGEGRPADPEELGRLGRTARNSTSPSKNCGSLCCSDPDACRFARSLCCNLSSTES